MVLEGFSATYCKFNKTILSFAVVVAVVVIFRLIRIQ